MSFIDISPGTLSLLQISLRIPTKSPIPRRPLAQHTPCIMHLTRQGEGEIFRAQYTATVTS